MSHCVLEFCQKPAFLFLSLVLSLAPSHLTSYLSMYLPPLFERSRLALILQPDLDFTLMSFASAASACTGWF